MKFCGWLCLLISISGVSLVNGLDRDERQFGEIAVPLITSLAKMFLSKILDNWLDPDNVDIVFIGRAFRIHKDGGAQVTVTDRASSQSVTITGKTLQDATNTACQNLLKVLLIKGIISIDDLHLPPTQPPSTLPPCGDQATRAYCKTMVPRGYCGAANVFHTFMVENCRQSCGIC